jgi:leader peptidase (prepilin peptidase)/N-methyltransferase
MNVPAWVVIAVAPIIGSWLGVLIRRWPRGLPVAMARSACEQCGHRLGSLDLVPLLSFAALRGRCRYCGTKISWFHICIELAAVSVAAAAFCVDSNGWQLWIDAGLGWALLTAAWIDAETFRLPDIITLPLVLAGLGLSWASQQAPPYNHAAAAALGYISFRLLDEAYFALRHRHGLGQGDAKLLAAAGAWLGLAAMPYVVMAAGLLGICMALLVKQTAGTRREQRISFGPPLALAFFAWQLFTRLTLVPF